MSVNTWACDACPPPAYCAPTRCYCGHPECHAYPSWVERQGQLSPKPTPGLNTERMAASWATREEPTWLDK